MIHIYSEDTENIDINIWLILSQYIVLYSTAADKCCTTMCIGEGKT